MIIGTVLLRLVPHAPNFAPISAIALFGGGYLNKKYALLVPLLIMLISDYLLLYINPFSSQFLDLSYIYPPSALLHKTTLYVYGSFLISGLIGIWLSSRKKPKYILSASLLASFQFFIITNFGVWAEGMYSRGTDGLLQSYMMGLPFLKWTILGDLFYTTMFFGSCELALKSKLRYQKVAEQTV